MDRTKYTLNELTRAIVLSRLFNQYRKKSRRLEQAALGSMNSSRGLKTYLEQSSSIQRESHLLDRLSLEVVQERSLLERRISNLESFFSNSFGEGDRTLQQAVVQ